MLQKRENWTGYLSLAPAFLLVGILIGYPILNTLFHSFTKWDGLNSTYIGVDNFIAVFQNNQIWLLLRNNLIFLISVPGILLISLMVSVLLFEEVPGWKFFRSVYFLPSILSTVVIGFLIKSLFTSKGVVNILLSSLGLNSLIMDWFNNVPTAFMILIMCFYWQTLGQGTLIFLSGLSTISSEIFEASRMDGAGWWDKFTKIILPSLVPTIFYFTVTNIIFVFIGLFGLVYSITGGGPGYETTPIDYMIYISSFQSGNFGLASSLSVILFIIVAFITYIQFKISEKLSE